MSKNYFRGGLAMLSKFLRDNAEVPITYKRFDGVNINTFATRGAVNYGTLNQIGDVALGSNHRDYIIRAELLDMKPHERDVIVDGDEIWEVYKSSGMQDCWKYSDPFNVFIRIYTRRLQ